LSYLNAVKSSQLFQSTLLDIRKLAPLAAKMWKSFIKSTIYRIPRLKINEKTAPIWCGFSHFYVLFGQK